MNVDLTRFFQILDERPFRPFFVDLMNGKRVRISHPENVHVFPDRTRVKEIQVYYPDQDSFSIFGPLSLCDLHLGEYPDVY